MGTAARMRRSAASMAATTTAAESSGRTAIFAATSSVSGPTCSVRRWMTRSICGAHDSIAATMAASVTALADSPISRLFISVARITATLPSSTPTASDPAPSQRASPVIVVSVTPANAKISPASAAESSSSTAGSSGALACRMKLRRLRPARRRLVSAIAVRKEKASSTSAMASTPNATAGLVMCSGWAMRAMPS